MFQSRGGETCQIRDHLVLTWLRGSCRLWQRRRSTGGYVDHVDEKRQWPADGQATAKAGLETELESRTKTDGNGKEVGR